MLPAIKIPSLLHGKGWQCAGACPGELGCSHTERHPVKRSNSKIRRESRRRAGLGVRRTGGVRGGSGGTRGGERRSGSESRHRLPGAPSPPSFPAAVPGAPAHALLSPAQGQIEVDSETVFKLAALVLQVSVSPRLGLARHIPLPGFFFFPHSLRTSPRRVVGGLRGWGVEGKLEHIGVIFLIGE